MPDDIDREQELADGFWVGDWFVEPMLNRVAKKEEQVQLEPKVMDVLLLMAERPSKTVTKEEFMNRVWAGTVVTEDVLSRCISQLRKTFDDDSRNPDYIETIRKTGYRLIAPVRVPPSEEAPHADEPANEATANEATANEAGGTSQEREVLTGTVQRLSNDLGSITSDAKEKWVVVAGGAVERRWVLMVVGLLLVIAAGVGFFIVRNSFLTRPSANPLDPVPLTSFSGLELDPALSPDGRQIVFAWDGENQGPHNIYLMQKGAEMPLRLTTAKANEWSPTWSPDGRFVAFVRELEEGNGIFVVSSIGGNARRVAHFPTRNVQSIAWSPDTSRQALVLSLEQRPHQTYSLYRREMDADTLVQLTDPPSFSAGDTDPAFSPSGNRIAFTRTLIDDVQDVYVVDAEGGPSTQVTTDSTRITGLDWTPDGKGLVFASQRGGTSGLWRVPAGGGPPEWITTASEGTQLHHPSLARQGNRLTYTQQSSRLDIWKLSNPLNYEAVSTERFISSTQWDSNPSISPRGARVAFASRRSGYPEIWTAAPEGGDLKQITSFEGPSTHSPQWSPDGTQIAFVSRQQGSSDLFVVRSDGFQPKRLTSASSEDLLPFWSHDGSAIYFTSNRSGAWEIWKIPAEGGSAVQVTRGGAVAAQEHPDGSSLYVVRADTTGIWELPLADASLPLSVGSPASMSDMPPDQSSSDTTSATMPPARQVVSSLLPSDRANWHVRSRGIYFLRREDASTVLTFYRFSTHQTTSLFLLKDVPFEPSLSASPEGDWFLHTREGQRESDILLVEDFR